MGNFARSFLQILAMTKRALMSMSAALALLLSSTQTLANDYTPALTGFLGLNTVPSARMHDSGTLTATVSTLDPYQHSSLGFQLDDALWVGLRQSAEISSLKDDAERLYPGMDLKLRLLTENRSRPEISIGLQSAIGHKRMAGEYLALSKRYKSFDFTGGIGWGRFGSAGHFDNPLKSVSSHFGEERRLDGEDPQKPSDWFTGEKAGLFAGIEYFTPLKGLSIKADYGADRYEAEKAAFDYEPAAPWSIGASYTPWDWLNANLAMQGADKIMARLTLLTNPQNWGWGAFEKPDTKPFRPYRGQTTDTALMAHEALKNGFSLKEVTLHPPHSVRGTLELDPRHNMPFEAGRAMRAVASNAGPDIEQFEITTRLMGLQGPSLSLNRADFEKAHALNHGSAEEIWKNAEINAQKDEQWRAYAPGEGNFKYGFILDTQSSLSEEDTGGLYRTSAIANVMRPELFGFLTAGAGLRLNLADNLNRLTDIRPRSFLPVRSDVDVFAARTLAVDHNYLSFMHTLRPNLHGQFTLGYLEEMYAGFGGEILYRPYDSRWAIGAESWIALKRDPFTDLNLGLTGDRLLTGHLNIHYDLPHHDLTAHLKLGRFLAEDIGGTLSLSRTFRNGTALEGFVTMTDKEDFDLFGGTTHSYSGLKLSIPLGGLTHVPDGVRKDFTFAPLGRDLGQAVDTPLPLYELTEPFSLRHIEAYWNDILE